MKVIKRNSEGLEKALAEIGIEARYNLRASRAEIKGFWNNPSGWHPINDRTVSAIQDRIESGFAFDRGTTALFGSETWQRYFNALLSKHEVDPFAQWLTSLPTWDGQQRLFNWLADVFTVNRYDPLLPWVCSFPLMGAVKRTFAPGTKLDEMPVLIGPQGIGKSTALAALLPASNSEWFTDSFTFHADPKTQVEAVSGAVIVEAAEMVGSTRQEIEAVKVFLSRTEDKQRLAYRKDPEYMRRLFVMVGTTNDPECLPNDATGNRRFVPLEIRASSSGAVGVREYLSANRGQLWAEALYQVNSGTEARLPDALKSAQAQANEVHRSKLEVVEDAVDTYLRTAPDHFKLAEAMTAMGMNKDDVRAQRAVAKTLRNRKYERKEQRINGEKAYWWTKD